MENNIWSDFGFFITDGDDTFENGYEVPSEKSFDDMKNSDSTETLLMIDENRKDQHEFFDQQPIIDLDDFFLPLIVGENEVNFEQIIAIDQFECRYDKELGNPIIDLDHFWSAESDPVIPDAHNSTNLNFEISSDHDEDETNNVNPNELVRAVKKKKISKRDQARLRRENGLSYLGYSKQNSKIKQNMVRPPRRQGPPCKSRFCSKSSLRQCNLFPDIDRPKLFKKFWRMNWDQKELYICNLIEETAIKQRKTDETLSRRQKSRKYFLITAKGKRLQVCAKMFLKTFGLNEKMIRAWLDHEEEFGLRENPVEVQKRKNKSRQQSQYNQVLLERKIRLLTFLIDYPKMESHYCRKDTEKEYFETTHQTLTDLYKQYVDVCTQENSRQLSFPVISGTLKNLNFCLFKPRKDQCDECIAYKTGNSTIEQYEKHRANVERAAKEKDSDIILAVMKAIILLCMDVEGVVLCPKLLASALYFKSKLQLHNFTLYEILTHDSTNYVWDESEGDLQSSTFTSIVVHHLEQRIKTSPLPITIYSDGCTYQNRNLILSNALRLFAMKHSRTVTQKFLEVGHTHMECDSTHACIDRKMKNLTLSSPKDFEDAILEAREKPFPFVVKHLDYTFFRNYDDEEYLTLKSIRPGKSKGDPKVTDIHCLRYSPGGEIHYKLRFDDDFKLLPQKINNQSISEPKSLHESRLPVSYAKWKHLQELKGVLDPKCHAFYDDIPHHEEQKKIVSENEKLKSIMEKIKYVKRAPKTQKIKNLKSKTEKAPITPKDKNVKAKTKVTRKGKK